MSGKPWFTDRLVRWLLVLWPGTRTEIKEQSEETLVQIVRAKGERWLIQCHRLPDEEQG